MGVARIFQRGGHTVSDRGYSRFRNLNIVGCLSKKRLTKGGHGHQDRNPPPLPSYALERLPRYNRIRDTQRPDVFKFQSEFPKVVSTMF